jgi:hypothetical protein
MNSSGGRFQTYLFSYQHEGATWGFEIKAQSPEDAKARLAKLAKAHYDGILLLSVPVPQSVGGKLARWLGRKFGRGPTH